MPCLVLIEILQIINKSQFLFSVKYAVKFVWWKHVAHTHIGELFQSFKCQNTRKTRLICIFWLFEDLSLMMENVLVKFKGTGYSFISSRTSKFLKVTLGLVPGQACMHAPSFTPSVQKTHWKSLTAGQSL